MESKKTIDINANLGEFQNASELTNELNILKYILSTCFFLTNIKDKL